MEHQRWHRRWRCRKCWYCAWRRQSFYSFLAAFITCWYSSFDLCARWPCLELDPHHAKIHNFTVSHMLIQMSHSSPVPCFFRMSVHQTNVDVDKLVHRRNKRHHVKRLNVDKVTSIEDFASTGTNNLFPRMPGAGLCCIAVLRGRMVMAEHRHLRDIREKPETVGLGAVSAVSAEVRAVTRSDVAARASSYGGVVTVVRCSTHKSKQFVEKNKLHYDLWNLPEATRNLPFAKVGSMPPGKNNKSSKSAKSRATRSSRVERVMRVKVIRAVRAIGRSINTKGSKTSCTRFGQCFQEKSGTKTPVRLFGGAFSC